MDSVYNDVNPDFYHRNPHRFHKDFPPEDDDQVGIEDECGWTLNFDAENNKIYTRSKTVDKLRQYTRIVIYTTGIINVETQIQNIENATLKTTIVNQIDTDGNRNTSCASPYFLQTTTSTFTGSSVSTLKPTKNNYFTKAGADHYLFDKTEILAALGIPVAAFLLLLAEAILYWRNKQKIPDDLSNFKFEVRRCSAGTSNQVRISTVGLVCYFDFILKKGAIGDAGRDGQCAR